MASANAAHMCIVSNLPLTPPLNTIQQGLRQVFAPFGQIVDVTLSIDRVTGKFKGVAFVAYTTEKAVQDAIAALNGTAFQGSRRMVVAKAA